MDDLPVGAVVEIQPAGHALKPADRAIAQIARNNDGLYSTELHRAADPSASERFIQAHVRRLEALRRKNIADRFSNGSWDIPVDFENRIEGAASRSSRYPGRVATLSFLPLDQQIHANGATWLDRQLLARDPTSLRGVRFGAIATEALERRRDHLIAQGLAEQRGTTLRFQRNLLAHLRHRDVLATAERIATQTGLSFTASVDGQRIDGLYRRPIRLASGKFAVIEMSREFTLVPWRSVLERRRGKSVSGIMRGGAVSLDLSRKRGLDIG